MGLVEDDGADVTSVYGSTANSVYFDAQSSHLRDDRDEVAPNVAFLTGATTEIDAEEDYAIVV